MLFMSQAEYILIPLPDSTSNVPFEVEPVYMDFALARHKDTKKQFIITEYCIGI